MGPKFNTVQKMVNFLFKNVNVTNNVLWLA